MVDRLPDVAIESVIAATRRLSAGCLVLPASDTLLGGEALRLLREELSCPVVVQRESGSSEVNSQSFVATD